MQVIFTPKHYTVTRNLRRSLNTLSLLLWTIASILLLTPVFPHILYRLSPTIPQTLAKNLGSSLPGSESLKPRTISLPLPPLDETLPKQNRLIINKIGVDGEIHEGTWEEALTKGLWREPQFGTPDGILPVVLAAHRWGYVNWNNTFRRQNSFYSLPKLEVDDEVQIIWNQRKYVYRVYKAQTGETITDFTADLILYTCELWDSPTRIFRYAKRIT